VYDVEIADRQSAVSLDIELIARAVREVLTDADVRDATVSVAVVGDQEIHELNRRYLSHDYPTDVLSFLLDRRDESKGREAPEALGDEPVALGGEPVAPPCCLDGEVVVSAETARREAPQYGWTAGDELLLYVVHGTLHLVGYDDATESCAALMQEAQSRVLSRLGRPRPDDGFGDGSRRLTGEQNR
jgi:probable rRNA maturation factor